MEMRQHCSPVVNGDGAPVIFGGREVVNKGGAMR
jgi:hypothetical protein